MKPLIGLAVLVTLSAPVFADGLLPPKSPQVIEVTMPDGHKEQGFIQDGKFIPIVQPSAQPAQATPKSAVNSQPVKPISMPAQQTLQSGTPAPATQTPPPIIYYNPNQLHGQATYTAPTTSVQLDQNQHIDSNQNIHSNNYNYNVNRQDHDTLDTVKGIGDLFLRSVTTFSNIRR